MTKVVTSKQYTLNVRDIVRGLLVGIIMAAIPVIQETIDTWVAGGDFVVNVRQLVDVSWKATLAYLTLNFFSQTKIMALPEKKADVQETEKQVKKVV